MCPAASPQPLVFASAQSGAFASSVARELGMPLAACEEREFEDGEHKMRPLAEVRGRSTFIIQSLHGDAGASVNDRLCRLLFFAGALKDAGAAHVTACFPYLAYARKDRRTQPRDPVTTRYVARLCEASGIDRVVVLDVHNEAAFDNAFRCETVRVDAIDLFASALGLARDSTGLVIASPDPGGIKRAERFRYLLNARFGVDAGFAFMEKVRRAGVLSGEHLVGDVAGSDLVIVDDLIASGATVLRAVQAARRGGARRIRVVATHAPLTAAAVQMFGAGGPDQVFVTDSVPLRAASSALLQDRLSVCSAAPLFAQLIQRLDAGEPIGDLAQTG